MKTKGLTLIAILFSVLLSGCYMNLSAPSLAVAAKMDADSFSSVGEASCSQILWVFGLGDCSLHSAMYKGRITKLHHVDVKTKMLFFGAWSELTVVAYGE